MKLYLPAGQLKRRADTDVSDLTTAKRTGEPRWSTDEPDVLVIPFDTEPTASEQDAIRQRLTSEGGVEESLRGRAWSAYAELKAFEQMQVPGNPDIVRIVKLLCKVARALIRLQLRKLDAAD